MLECSISGHKLDPLIIFRGKADGSIEKIIHDKTKLDKLGYPTTNIQYITQSKAWCYNTVMLSWIRCVYH